MSARVVHVKQQIEGAVYIGRQNNRYGLAESRFANPFPIGSDPQHVQRAAVIEQYRRRLFNSPSLLRALPELRDKPLACWCRYDGVRQRPRNSCHGDVLVDVLKRYSDDELRAMAEERANQPDLAWLRK